MNVRRHSSSDLSLSKLNYRGTLIGKRGDSPEGGEKCVECCHGAVLCYL